MSKKLPENNSDILELTKTGTPFFMAPELKKLKFLGDYKDEIALIDGCRADIYSLGITMLSLICPHEKQSS